MQVVAVYYEERPKTYGLNQMKGLSLISTVGDLQGTATHIKGAAGGANDGPKFLLAILEQVVRTEARLYFLVASGYEKEVVRLLNEGPETRGIAPKVDIISGVELVYFQGPHFGDRWGIAYNAFRALEKREIRVLAASLSGAAIFLVFPEGVSDKAVSCLKEVFEVP